MIWGVFSAKYRQNSAGYISVLEKNIPFLHVLHDNIATFQQESAAIYLKVNKKLG